MILEISSSNRLHILSIRDFLKLSWFHFWIYFMMFSHSWMVYMEYKMAVCVIFFSSGFWRGSKLNSSWIRVGGSLLYFYKMRLRFWLNSSLIAIFINIGGASLKTKHITKIHPISLVVHNQSEMIFFFIPLSFFNNFSYKIPVSWTPLFYRHFSWRQPKKWSQRN